MKEAPTLTIIRGLPGSGKTTLARQLAQKPALYNLRTKHLETDMFFTSRDGSYTMDHALLPRAHRWCETETIKALRGGMSVVVSNTFHMARFLKPYLEAAERRAVRVAIIKCTGRFKSVHGVPEAVMSMMAREWEDVWNEIVFDGTAEIIPWYRPVHEHLFTFAQQHVLQSPGHPHHKEKV